MPCGIYNDQLRVQLIKEHITTVEKSMNKIKELSAAETINYNQLVRWVDNKESHANEIQHIVSQYFMTQRIKVVDGSDAAAVQANNAKLDQLHKLLVYAMKSKQTTEQQNIDNMRTAIDAFSNAYFSKEDLEHTKGHH